MRTLYKGSLIVVGMFLLFGLLIAFSQSAGSITIIKLLNEGEIQEIAPQEKLVPVGKWGSAIAFGDKGEIVIAGTASILFSPDGGKNWQILSGGKGYEHISHDGGLTYRDFEDHGESDVSKSIDSKKLCYVESAKVESHTSRLYLRSNCSHSGQLWSIPLYGEGDWYVNYFVSEDESSRFLAPDNTFVTAGDRLLVRGLTRGGAIILTSDDSGKSWRPFWHKSFFDAGVTDFSFIDADTGWILKSNGTIVQTKDGGQTWSPFTTLPSDKKPYSISFITESVGFVVGRQGLILLTKDNGKTWQDHSKYDSVDWYKVSSDHEGTWISGNSDMILGTLNEGKTWLTGKVSDEEKVYSRLSVHEGQAFFVQNQKIFSFSEATPKRIQENQK